jgi:hypothetical protein
VRSGSSSVWLLQRIALLDSPLLMIAAVASLFTDRPLLAVALALLSFGLYMLGRPSLGMRHPPGDPRNPERPAEPAEPARERRAGRGRGGSGPDRTRIRKTPL